MTLRYILFLLSSFFMQARAQFFSYYDGSKWGVVNGNNKVVVQPGFDAEIKFASNGYAIVKRNDKFGVVDTMGKLLVPCIYKELKFTKGPLIAHTEKGWSLVSTKSGRMYGLDDFDEIQFNNTTDVTVVAEKDHKSGLVSIKTGKWVNDKRYSRIALLDEAKRLYIVADDNSSRGMITADGKEFLPVAYRRIKKVGDSLRTTDNNGRMQSFSISDLPNYPEPAGDVISGRDEDYNTGYGYGVIDLNAAKPDVNAILKDLKTKGYDSLKPFVPDGLGSGIKAVKNGHTGALSFDGKVIIPLIYDDVEYVQYFYLVHLNGKVGIRHLRDHRILAEPMFRKVFHDSYVTRYCFVEMPDGKMGYYDLKNGKLLIPDNKGTRQKK
jgi:hypothetical protein